MGSIGVFKTHFAEVQRVELQRFNLSQFKP